MPYEVRHLHILYILYNDIYESITVVHSQVKPFLTLWWSGLVFTNVPYAVSILDRRTFFLKALSNQSVTQNTCRYLHIYMYGLCIVSCHSCHMYSVIATKETCSTKHQQFHLLQVLPYLDYLESWMVGFPQRLETFFTWMAVKHITWMAIHSYSSQFPKCSGCTSRRAYLKICLYIVVTQQYYISRSTSCNFEFTSNAWHVFVPRTSKHSEASWKVKAGRPP